MPYYPVYGRHPHAFPSSVCGRGRRHLPPRGKALLPNKGVNHVSSFLPIRSSAPRAGGAGCFAVPELFAAAALTAGGPVAGAVLRIAACADGRAGIYQPRPARAGHRVCRTSCDILLHRYRHRSGAAPHRRHTADCLAYYLAGRHNAVAVDGPYHVVGAAACAAALYDKIQPDNAEKSAERQADHRAGQ